MKNIRSSITRYVQAFALLIALIPSSLGAAAMPGPGQIPGPGPMPGTGDMFNISEAEMNQIVEALNDLSPDQLKELEDLGRATEERMKQQDLDPNNPNDWMKFMEKEGLMQQPPEKPQHKKQPREKPRPMPRPQQMKPLEPQKPISTAVTSQADTKVIIEELIKHLESLKQKAITRSAIMKRLGSVQDQVDKLSLYLNLIQAPDIITLLSTEEFEGLHNSLDQLHKSFITLEPSISARERSLILNEDDPYEVLDLPYSATPEEIEARYADLAAERSPKAIEAQLSAEGCDNKVCKRIVKAAERTFRLIKRSYEQLKNPEARAKLDATLTDKITREASKEQVSMRAFDQLFTSMNKAFTQDRIITELSQLLEKHKPQELEQAKLQQQREKEAYERSKRRVIVPQVKPGRANGRQQGPYDSFYRKMGQQRYGRPGGPGRPSMRPGGRPTPQRGKQPGKPGAPGDKKDGGKPSAKPADKKDEAKDKKEDKKDKKKATPKPMDVKPSDDDLDLILEMKGLNGILKDAKEMKDKITKTRSGSDKVDEYKLNDIMRDVQNQLTTSTDQVATSTKKLKHFYDEYRLEELRNHLKKIAPGKGKKLTDPVKEHWKKSGAQYGKLINNWYEQIHNHLDPLQLDQQYSVHINSAKAKRYNLDQDRIKPWKKEKEGEKKPDRPKVSDDDVDLGIIRDTVYSIKEYYDNITDAAK